MPGYLESFRFFSLGTTTSANTTSFNMFDALSLSTLQNSLTMDEDQIEYISGIIYLILSSLAMPLFWLETLLFRMLGLPTSTSFRMFRRPDTVPEGYTDVAYSYTLITIMLIPTSSGGIEIYMAEHSLDICSVL
ncbi:hypothetical protein B0T22DRAFT_451218 [Podospora appendiculata]|uniref:Uncharacterized protein n=1 Tax=Podospora appendiculata TaxID=314037 RepID=A0AAE0XIA3_9PEZI|nr:hypothetical protein B0T22DRAFT_451218 [Podospora appendiculata]